jgi:hypothetical protein
VLGRYDRMTGGKVHVVRSGDTVEALAEANGLFWERLWFHPENDALRKVRDNPNVLLPGDRLFIPARRPKTVSISTNRRHTYRRRGVPSKFIARILDLQGRPRAHQRYTLEAGAFTHDGHLDAEGRVEVFVPPQVTRVHLRVGEGEALEEFEFQVGHLDPIEELSGVVGRLVMLGFYDGPDLTEPSPDLHAAVMRFRVSVRLPQGGIDDELRAALVEAAHG